MKHCEREPLTRDDERTKIETAGLEARSAVASLLYIDKDADAAREAAVAILTPLKAASLAAGEDSYETRLHCRVTRLLKHLFVMVKLELVWEPVEFGE